MYSTKMLGEIKLICWSTGPTDPILSKNKKILANWLFYLIYCFMLFEKREKKYNNLI